MPENIKDTPENMPPTPQDGNMDQETDRVQNPPDTESGADTGSEAENLAEKLDELSGRYLRLVAEYDNYRKRTARERDSLYRDAQASVAAAFLNVADNFSRAMEASTTDPDFKRGIELIHSGFTDTLLKLGVERFGDVGDSFDPACHEALAQIEQEDAEPGTVVQVYSPGYRMGDKILRHAAVVVAN